MTTEKPKLENTGLDEQNRVLVRMGKALEAFRTDAGPPGGPERKVYNKKQLGRILGTTAIGSWEHAKPELVSSYLSRSGTFRLLMETMHEGEQQFNDLLNTLVGLQGALLVCEVWAGADVELMDILDTVALPLKGHWHSKSTSMSTAALPEGVTVVIVSERWCNTHLYGVVRELCRQEDVHIVVVPEDRKAVLKILERSLSCAANHPGLRSRIENPAGAEAERKVREAALSRLDERVLALHGREEDSATDVPNPPPEEPAYPTQRSGREVKPDQETGRRANGQQPLQRLLVADHRRIGDATLRADPATPVEVVRAADPTPAPARHPDQVVALMQSTMARELEDSLMSIRKADAAISGLQATISGLMDQISDLEVQLAEQRALREPLYQKYREVERLQQILLKAAEE